MSSRLSGTSGVDLTSGRILPSLLKFALPLLAANLIQQLYVTLDMLIIGRVAGNIGTVGVSVGGQAAQFFTMLAISFGSGGQVYVSQLFGAGDKKGVNETIGTLLSSVTVMAVVLMAVALPLSNTILGLMNTPPEAFEAARGYMIVTCCGYPFIFGYNAIGAAMRGRGDSRRPLLFVSVAAVVHVVLCLLFVAVLKMGAAGAALSTVLGQGAGCVYALIYMNRNREQVGFDFGWNSFKIRWKRLSVLLKLGIPLIVQNGCIQFTLIYVNSLVNAYGMIASATNSVGEKIFNMANTLSVSLNAACAATIGQNLGAGKLERAKKVVLTGFAVAMCIFLFSGSLALLIPKQVYSLFTDDPAVIEFGVTYLRVTVVTIFLAGAMGPCQAMVTGSGFASLGLAVGILDGVVFRLGLAWLFTSVFHMGVVGLWLATALARLGPVLICGGYLVSGKWRTRKLLVDRLPEPEMKMKA